MPTWAPYLGHELASFFGSCLFNSSSPNKNWKLTATRVALFGETNSPKNKRSNAKHIKCLGQLKYAGLTERRCSLSLSLRLTAHTEHKFVEGAAVRFREQGLETEETLV